MTSELYSPLYSAAHQAATKVTSNRIAQPSSRVDNAALVADLLSQARHASADEIDQTISALKASAQHKFGPSPSESYGFAYVVHTLARETGESVALAEAALFLSGTLNYLGDFREGLSFALNAVSQVMKIGDTEQMAQAHCQAALACTFTGDLAEARLSIHRARETLPSHKTMLDCDWLQARVLRADGDFDGAETVFEATRDGYAAEGLQVDAARCEREYAHTRILRNRESLALLEHARGVFESSHHILDATLCDYLSAIALGKKGDYQSNIELLNPTRARFLELGAELYAAWCEMELGICALFQDRYDDADRYLLRAREYFDTHDIPIEVSACEINLGLLREKQNSYDQALEFLQHAAELSLAENRATRRAIIYGNMAEIYSKQCRWVDAINSAQRALTIAEAKKLPTPIVTNNITLGRAFRELGDYPRALGHLERALSVSTSLKRDRTTAECSVELADLHFVCLDLDDAETLLSRTRENCREKNLESLRAQTDALLARVALGKGEWARSLSFSDASRKTFMELGKFVDAALADLTKGEALLLAGERANAVVHFERAQRVLAPAFRDHLWRADVGLAQGALRRNDLRAALEHLLVAARSIADSRTAFGIEKYSNWLFTRKRSIFEDGMALARTLKADAITLELIELAKARAFLFGIQQRGWKWRKEEADPYLAELIARQHTLSDRLNGVRERSARRPALEFTESRYGAADDARIESALQSVNALAREHDALVLDIQRLKRGLAGVSALARFSTEDWRTWANADLGKTWAALDYFLSGNLLTRVLITPQAERVETKTLSQEDLSALNECIDAINAPAAPTPASDGWERLYDVLIPHDLNASLLIISPHGPLHGLAFPALKKRGRFLIQDVAITFTPNLQAMQLLLQDTFDPSNPRALICGVSDFGGREQTLLYTGAEMENILRLLPGSALPLWQVSYDQIMNLQKQDKLREYTLVHFATHTVLDRVAPYQSRIILSEGELTAADVLDLELDARLVVLSGCQTAKGELGSGDDMTGLVPAFFYAGARAVIATLGQANDRAAAVFMPYVYPGLGSGDNIAQVLRTAQVKMIEANRPLNDWAPFVMFGKP